VHVFTCGSLMFPEIWSRVVRRSYRAVPARVAGFGRYALPDVTYPGMVAERDSHVDGVLYLDVEAGDLPALDRFEATNTAGKRWK
jgi:hypothetical protein